MFVFLLFVFMAVISSWLKKQAARTGSDDSSPDQSNNPQNRPQPITWEEQLRRMLNEEQPTPPSLPPRPPPPPVVSRPRPAPQRPAPSPPVVIRPTLISRREPERGIEPLPVPPLPAGIQVSSGQLAPMTESRQAYERGSEIQQQMSAQISQIQSHKVMATSVMRRAASPDIAGVVSLFKSGRTARQAVIASVILGTPRSLDENPALPYIT